MEATKAALVLLLCLPATLIAGPVKYSWQDNASRYGTKCASTCRASSNFGYKDGTVYRYAYEVTGTSSIAGASDQSSVILASATVQIHAVSNCEMAMTLSDVKFKTSEPDSPWLKELTPNSPLLEENALYFSFQDGRVDELCPTGNDNTEVLNFKRGILSAFQNSMRQHITDQSLREIDVSGNCPTQYVVSQKGWKSTQISKTKDLLGCSDHQFYTTSLQSTPFHFPDAIQSLPILKGDLKCSQTITKKGILSKSSCSETLVFRPFSKKESGAKTETAQKLEYLDSSRSYLRPVNLRKKTSLIFDHVNMRDAEGEEIWDVRDKIQELCKISSRDISREVPGLFSELIYLMKNQPYDGLNDLWMGVNSGLISTDSKESAKQFLLDALPMVGTKDSVKLMVDLLVSDVVSGVRSTLWVKSFAFLQHPNKEMIRDSFNRLLKSYKYRMEALLPVTSAINNYCSNQEGCGSQQEVIAIANILDELLGRDCKGSDENLILTTLRAVGNLGSSDDLFSTLENCIEMSGNNMNVRVSAVQAFRGITCQASRRSLIDVFVNKGEDSELRINAYLGIMMCPTNLVLRIVKETLDNEEVDQVGSFVWTHLTNLAETSSPLKQEVKEILQDEKLKKEFDMDKRKYSRNYEISHFSERFGTGAMAESNLIWSSSSFVPRSAMLNLTVDVLGRSVNLLEVGGRAQGLQELFQEYIGNKLKSSDDKNEASSPSGCFKQSKMDDMKEKHGVKEDDLSASLYVRMFGNDMAFKHFTKNDFMAFKNKMSPKEIMTSLAKGEEISSTHSAMFLDSTITVPTIAGMSLQLSVNGTASVQLKASMKMDYRRISLKKVEINFNLEPSGAVQIGGEMTLKTIGMKSGLKMTTTLHSSTALKGSLDTSKGQELRISADTPREKSEIFNVQSEFFIIHTNAVHPQKMLEDKAAVKQEACSVNSMLKHFGYELCGDVSYVNASTIEDAPYFPLTGPLSASIVLHKKDAPQGFKLVAENVHDAGVDFGRLLIDTPGSKVDRAMGLSYFLNTKTHSLELEAKSPWKKFMAKGSYDTNPKSYKLAGSVSFDEMNYELTMKLNKDQQGKKVVWTPSLVIMRPKDSKLFTKGPESMNIGGSISVAKDQVAVDIDILTKIKPNPIKLQANYINKKAEKTLSGVVTLNSKEGYSATFRVLQTIYGKNTSPSKIKPTILISAPNWRLFLLSGDIDIKKDKVVKSNIHVTMDQTLKSPIVLSLKLQKSKSKYRGIGKLSSQFGIIKSKGYMDVPQDISGKKKGPLLSTKITTSYNLPAIKDRKLRKNFVVVSSKIHDRSSKSLTKYDASVILESRNYQAASFRATFGLTHKDTFTKSLITFKKGPKSKYLKDKTKQLKIETSLDHQLSKDDVNIKYDVQLLYPIKAIEWQINGKHEHHLKKNFGIETYNSLIFAKGKSSEFRLKIDDNAKQHMDYSGLLQFNYPTFVLEGKKYQARSYKIFSSVEQKDPNKEIFHSLKINVDKDQVHSMFTKLKRSEGPNHNLISSISIGGKQNTKLTIKSDYSDNKAEAFVKVVKDNKVYEAETVMTRENDGYFYTHSWDVAVPSRRVKGSWQGGIPKQGDVVVKFLTLYDANKDNSKKIDIIFVLQHEEEEPIKEKFLVESHFKSPFEGYKIFAIRRLSMHDLKESRDEYKVVWGSEEHEYGYKYWQLNPASPERFQFDFELVTPHKDMRMYRIEMRHKIVSSQHLSTSIKSKYNENDVAMDILYSNKRSQIQGNFDGKFEFNFLGAKRDTIRSEIGHFPDDLTFNPLMPDMPKRVKLLITHKNNGHVFESEAVYARDEVVSTINGQTTYTRVGKMINLKTDASIILPLYFPKPIHFNMRHVNSLTTVNTTLSSTWGYHEKANLDVGATFTENDKALYIHYSGTTKFLTDLVYKHQHNSLNGWKGSTFKQMEKDGRKYISGSTYKLTKTEFSHEAFSNLDKHSFQVDFKNFPYTAHMNYSYLDSYASKWKEFILDGSVIKNGEKDWTSNMRLVTPIENVRNIGVKGNLLKSGNDWKLKGDISWDVRKEIKLTTSVDAENWSKLYAEFENPWKNVVLTVDNKKNKRHMKTEVKIKFDEDKEITAKVTGKYRFPEKSAVSFELSTPYDQLRYANLRSHLSNVDNKWMGSMNWKSSLKKLKTLNLDFEHALSESSFENKIEMTSSAFDKVATGIQLKWGDIPSANFNLVAPHIRRTVLGFTKNSKSWLDFQNRVFGEVQGHELDIDIGLKHEEVNTKAWFTFSYPGANKSFIKTNIHRFGNSLMDFDVGGDLRIGKQNKPYNVSVQFSFIKNKTALGTTFETPFITKSVSFLFKNEYDGSRGQGTIFAKYGDEQMLNCEDSFEMTDSMHLSSRKLSYLFNGKGHSTGYRLDSKWSGEGEKFSLISNLDENVITLEGSHTPTRDSGKTHEIVDLSIATPFDNYRELELHSSMTIESDDAHGRLIFEYMDGEEADLSFHSKKINSNHLIVNGSLSLPIRGYEQNTFSVSSMHRANLFLLEVEAVTGQAELLKATMKIVDSESFFFEVLGPIKEFKSLQVFGKFNMQQKTLNGKAQLHLLLDPSPAILVYNILVNDPMQLNFKLSSPYENFRKAGLTVKLWDADLNRYNSKSILTSERLGKIQFETQHEKSDNYLKGMATLTSSIKNMENLKLSFEKLEQYKQRSYQMEVGWDDDKEIVIHSSASYGPSIASTFKIETPFEEIRILNIKFSQSEQAKITSRNIYVQHNDHIYFDGDMNYNMKGHKFTIDMRHPKPMSINIDGEIKDKLFDGKILLNWDKNSPQSQFKFIVHGSDKSVQSNIDTEFSFKMIHPVRIMAVEYLLRKADNEMQTSGLITWDESKGNTFSYDIGYTDRSSMYSEMYDAHVKVGVPQRSVKLLGSYGTGSIRTMTGTALWDADRDESKKVTLSTTHEYSKRMERLGLNLNLPSINKQLNVGVGLKRGYGSSIMDSKVEVSYSSDPSKTITITNKIRNTVMDKKGKGSYNYTMETYFKHAITDIDLQWLSHVGQIDKIMSVGSQFTYLTLNKEHKVFGWRIETDNDETGTVVITSPVKSITVVGKRTHMSYAVPSCSVKILEDGRKTLAFSGKLRPKARQFDVSLQYDRDDSEKILYVNGAYVSDNSAEMSIFDSQKVLAKVNIKLNSSNIIHHKLVWEPSLPADFKNFMGTKVTAFSYITKEIWEGVVKSVGDEVETKYLRVSQELRDEIGLVFALMQKEMENFNVQLETLRTQIRRLYNRNDLHIKDMGQQIESALRELMDTIQDLVKNYRSYYNNVVKVTSEWINNLKNYPISLMYGKTINDLVEVLEEVRMVLEKALQDLATELQKVSEVSYKKYVELSRDIDRKLNSFIESKQKLAVFKQMMKERKKFMRMGADYQNKDVEQFDQFYYQTQQILEDQFHDLMVRSEFQQLHAMGTEVYQQFKYWNANRGVSEAMVRVVDLGKNLMLMELARLKSIFLDMKKTRVILYDSVKGEMQFEVYVPFEMKALGKPPEFKIGRYMKDAYQWIEERAPDANSSIWDLYYENVPSLNPSKWVPPFEATAYIVGNQHIITFDNSHYDFLSSCSHVLVRDMVKDSFSVVVNYEKNPVVNGIKSLCYTFDKSLTLEITKDYKLTVNSQKTEMPYISDSVSVLREGNAVVVRYVNGLEVVSDPTLDLHKFILSGWFHGRIAGLLGNNDNEKGNDFSMTDRLHEFEVGRKTCSNKNLASKPDPNEDIAAVCSGLFININSQFRPCFRQVNSVPFHRMCNVYLSTLSEYDALYRSTEQYRSVCRDHGVLMGPIPAYSPCNKQEEYVIKGNDPLYQSADVVFITEDAKCNSWAPNSLSSIVNELNRAFYETGKKNNRYGLLGYNGDDVTVRTMHGEHFGKANSFLKAVETMRLEKSRGLNTMDLAIKKAVSYPYRAGVAKILVILPCSGCEVGLLDWNMDEGLNSAGFTVHVLINEGFDPFQTIGVSHTKEKLAKDKLVMKVVNKLAVIPPNPWRAWNSVDFCNQMAVTTGGSVIDSTVLTSNRARGKRHHIKKFVYKIATTAELPPCQRCACNSESGRISCNVCSSWSYKTLMEEPWTMNRVVSHFHNVHHDVKTSLKRHFA